MEAAVTMQPEQTAKLHCNKSILPELLCNAYTQSFKGHMARVPNPARELARDAEQIQDT
jgi:hypothetical protein